jgi:hypothetical protein
MRLAFRTTENGRRPDVRKAGDDFIFVRQEGNLESFATSLREQLRLTISKEIPIRELLVADLAQPAA